MGDYLGLKSELEEHLSSDPDQEVGRCSGRSGRAWHTQSRGRHVGKKQKEGIVPI